MEELKAKLFGNNTMIGDFCTEMYHKVDDKNPVMGLFNGVRIIMFKEE